MSNLSDIKNRIKVVGNTRRITKAMETVSVAKLGSAVKHCERNATYFEKLRETIGDIVLGTSGWVHPYFRSRKGDKAAFLVIASDKGLDGGYNSRVLEFAYDKISTYKNPIVVSAGDVTREYFTKKGISLESEFCDCSFEPTVEDSEEIAEFLIGIFDAEAADEVYIVYTGFHSSQKTEPAILKLLPLVKEDVCAERRLSAEKADYLKELYYEPDAEGVLKDLIPQYVSGTVYGCLLQSVAAEHLARRAAMNTATKNAEKILGGLKVKYNRVRQSLITSEITDIVTAAFGVKNAAKSR